LRVEDLLNLDTGDILAFDISVETELELEINGSRRFSGQIVDNGRKRSFLVNELKLPSPGERSDRRPLKSMISAGN
jgi:flagellar motor switch protein FliM